MSVSGIPSFSSNNDKGAQSPSPIDELTRKITDIFSQMDQYDSMCKKTPDGKITRQDAAGYNRLTKRYYNYFSELLGKTSFNLKDLTKLITNKNCNEISTKLTNIEEELVTEEKHLRSKVDEDLAPMQQEISNLTNTVQKEGSKPKFGFGLE